MTELTSDHYEAADRLVGVISTGGLPAPGNLTSWEAEALEAAGWSADRYDGLYRKWRAPGETGTEIAASTFRSGMTDGLAEDLWTLVGSQETVETL